MEYTAVLTALESAEKAIIEYKNGLRHRPSTTRYLGGVEVQVQTIGAKTNNLREITNSLLPPGEKCLACNGTGKRQKVHNIRAIRVGARRY